jgi:hypothetical protein
MPAEQIENGRYNITAECKNLTDEKLYDNFSLQKPATAVATKGTVVTCTSIGAIGKLLVE